MCASQKWSENRDSIQNAEIMISAGIHPENRSLPCDAPKCCSESGKVERSVTLWCEKRRHGERIEIVRE